MNLNNLVRNASAYVLGSFFVKGLTFITLPIFSRILEPSDFAFYSNYLFWVSLTTIIVGLQTGSSLNNAYIDYGDSNLYKYVSGISITSWITVLILFILTLIFQSSLTKLFELPLHVLLLGLIQSFFTYFFECLITIYRIISKPFRFLIFSIFNAVGDIIIAIIIIQYLASERYLGRVFSSTIIAFLLGLISALLIYKNGKDLFNYEYVKYSLKFSLPLIFHSMAAIMFTRCDQLMLIKLIDADTAGIYSYGTNFGHIMYVVYSAMNQAFVPWYYTAMSKSHFNTIKNILRKYAVVVLYIFIGLLLVMPEIIALMSDESYLGAKFTAPLIAYGFFINFLYTLPVNFEFYHKKTNYIAIGTVISSLLNIILNFILIPIYGTYGAAFATILTYSSLLILHVFIAKKIIKDYEMNSVFFLKFWVLGLIATIMYYLLIDYFFVRLILVLIDSVLVLTLFFKIKNSK